MTPYVSKAIERLDKLIRLYDALPTHQGHMGVYKHDPELKIRLAQAIHDLAPADSQYVENLIIDLDVLACVAKALRADFDDGDLTTIGELIHGALFADILDASQHLLDEGYKDAACVTAGGALESHIRQLCSKHGIDTNKPGGKPKKTAMLNDELKTADSYDVGTHKQVTAMLDLRNYAAHGHYDKYEAERVNLFIAEIRHFIQTYPA